MTHWSLLTEPAAQRIRQELRDAEAARRARRAQKAAPVGSENGRSVRRVGVVLWAALRAAAYAVARTGR